MAQGIPRRGKGGARCGGAVARGGRLGGEEEDDMWGPGVSGGERKGAEDGMREIKEKTYFAKYARDARGPSDCEDGGPGCGRRLGPAGRPRPVGVGRAG
jgi:hypothetical protein